MFSFGFPFRYFFARGPLGGSLARSIHLLASCTILLGAKLAGGSLDDRYYIIISNAGSVCNLSEARFGHKAWYDTSTSLEITVPHFYNFITSVSQ